MRKGNKVTGLLFGAALLIGAGAAGLVYANEYSIAFDIPDEEEIVLEYADDYQDNVKAVFSGTIFCREGIEVPVTKVGEPDPFKLGDYQEEYTAIHGKYSKTVTRTVHIVDTTPPEIELVTDPEHFTSPIAAYEEEGYKAWDSCDGDLTEQVTSEEKDGQVIYRVADSSGNETAVVRDIVYKDVVAPELTLAGEAHITWEYGEEYEDPGYSAVDDCDGDITEAVTVEGTVDVHRLGEYELLYQVCDSYQNSQTASRIVEVVDNQAPRITLHGDDSIYVKVGSGYKEPGYEAQDNVDGELTADVSVSGRPDTDRVGVYRVKYSVADKSGNSTEVSRTVYVFKEQSAAQTKNPGDKVVYLTFDDGPCKNTQKLLDVLDEYNVKATFFVTNQFPGYRYLIGEEDRRGHTVAIHSYSHEYKTIYSGEDAFFDDITRMSDIIEEQTGKVPTLLRFPGGSSNGVSKKYCTGIMTRLTESVGKMGYQYADWNVLSGDAGETTDTEVVKQNIIDGIQKHKVSTVLQHDLWDFSVDAVEDVIKWGLANGYTFLPLTEDSPMYHHSVNN